MPTLTLTALGIKWLQMLSFILGGFHTPAAAPWCDTFCGLAVVRQHPGYPRALVFNTHTDPCTLITPSSIFCSAGPSEFHWSPAAMPAQVASLIFTAGGWFRLMEDPYVYLALFFVSFAWVATFIGLMGWALRAFGKGEVTSLWPIRLLAMIGSFSATVRRQRQHQTPHPQSLTRASISMQNLFRNRLVIPLTSSFSASLSSLRHLLILCCRSPSSL